MGNIVTKKLATHPHSDFKEKGEETNLYFLLVSLTRLLNELAISIPLSGH